MSISDSSMLVELNISVWTANKVDRSASDKVAVDAHASHDAGLFKKNLMAGTSARKDIADYAALCRTWHNGWTLPWSDKGVRLLPTSKFMDYKQEANRRRTYFDTKVAEFLTNYQTLRGVAQQSLGDLFNPSDYPTEEEIVTKFGFRLVFLPIVETGDFRLDAPAAELAALKNQYEDAVADRVQEAMSTAWDKLYATLTGMSEKLAEPEDGATKVFHGTFVSNAMDMVELLDHFNVTNDPALNKARLDLEKAIAGVDILDIRQNAEVRADIKKQVDAVLGGYEW